jgi:hypothetical protein
MNACIGRAGIDHWDTRWDERALPRRKRCRRYCSVIGLLRVVEVELARNAHSDDRCVLRQVHSRCTTRRWAAEAREVVAEACLNARQHFAVR